MERHQPDREDLRHVDVKLQLILVEGWQYLISFFFFLW
jgi:hypothetical protein